MPRASDHIELQNPNRDIRLPVSIRAYAPSYAAAMLLLTFFAVFSFYLSFDLVGIAMAVASGVVVPVIAWGDKIVFDGKRLVRTGIMPRIWFRMYGLRRAVKLNKIEQVDTVTAGSFRRGGRVRFMHRTSIYGNGPAIVFSGAGKKYRTMVRALFPHFEPHILDCKSLDLRNYLAEPHEVSRWANRFRIPSAEVLDASISQRPGNQRGSEPTPAEFEAIEPLKRTANQLRVSGSLVRAMEAFRRALRIQPKDPWLLFDYSRCLYSLSTVDNNARIRRRAAASLRLAEKRASDDAELLERIGETYRQFGYSRRAASAYQAAIDRIGECFRALIGLAELALEEGKLAHVAHNFSAADRATRNTALKRWARSEADYFSHLSDDENYMELEASRMNLLEKLERWKSSAFRVALYTLPLIAAGVIFDSSLVADAGWLTSSILLVAWAAMSIVSKLLSPRIPYEMVEDDSLY